MECLSTRKVRKEGKKEWKEGRKITSNRQTNWQKSWRTLTDASTSSCVVSVGYLGVASALSDQKRPLQATRKRSDPWAERREAICKFQKKCDVCLLNSLYCNLVFKSSKKNSYFFTGSYVYNKINRIESCKILIPRMRNSHTIYWSDDLAVLDTELDGKP